MGNVNQTSGFILLGASFLALLIILFPSCGKNTIEIPGLGKTDVSALAQFSSSKMNNSIAAVPFDETLFVPCANNGSGENVALTGVTNFVYQMAWNDRGFSLVNHVNSQGLTGVGLSSGETFVGSDGTQGSVIGTWVNDQWIGTTIEQMKIIGRHTTYIIKCKYQLIVTPDGNVAVSIREKAIDCKR